VNDDEHDDSTDRAERRHRRSGADSHRVIRGRRWRVSDPALDDEVRQHLVDELMDARRAVKSALGTDDASAEQHARSRVHDAKVALGERGPQWWAPIADDDAQQRLDAFVRAIGTRRGSVPDDDAARRLLAL